MDPVVAAFGTALVGAIATDAWQQVREAVTGLCAGCTCGGRTTASGRS
jgi:hypothetical protein